MPDDYPVMTVLVHPDDNPAHPLARRLIYRQVDVSEWPWMRLTGSNIDVPKQGSDLTGWIVQHPQELAVVLGHPTWRPSW